MSEAIYSRPGETFYSTLDGAPTGLVGTVGVRILRKSDGEEVLARTTAAIGEAPANSGHYTATLTAPDTRDAYTVLWDTGAVGPSTTASDDLIVTSNLPEEAEGEEADWEPSLQEVASYIRARTKVPGGGLAGTFTTETKPTDEQARPLIRMAVDYISAGLGSSELCNDKLKRQARAATAMYAAMLIEQSYYPESTSNQGSSFKSLEALFNPALKRLEAAVEEQCGEGEGGEGGTGNMHPKAEGSFPTGPMAGGSGPESVW